MPEQWQDVIYCALCNRALNDGTMTCGRCLGRLDDMLAAIVESYALLPSVLLPGSVAPDGMPHGKQVDAPAPVRLDVLDLLDERTNPLDGEPRSDVLAVLFSWARLVREERQLSMDNDATVAGEVGFLRKHLQWIADQRWVDEFEREVKTLTRELRQVTGDSAPKPIGACPAEHIVDGMVQSCEAALYAPVYGDVVRCRRCGTQWTRDRWLILGKMIGQSEASA